MYCHADGTALKNGQTVQPGSVARQDFPFPFVFPSGRTCRSFDELALACLDEWEVACSLLRHGDLTSFLGGLGRSDLAAAAREAARAPDADRGLDQLISALPTRTVESAKLHVEPTQVNLGALVLGQEPRFQLHLHNRGMRLLTGSVTAYCVWLTLGDGDGAASKVFQFVHDLVIPVRVRGKGLRAGTKPLEGRLVLESSGGETTVIVRCEVPVRPFPGGLLAGAVTPRQIAEKAKANPKEAAAFFESGEVARWYQSNGWDYPVQGPSASGLGAVQQFFEALGLTAPPKVDLSEPAVFFIGDPGDALEHTIQVVAREKRPVYAHVVSDRPWLEVSRVKSGGRAADIRLAVAAVPDRRGELLHAKLTISANGNQRFVVPVTLAVGGPMRGSLTEPARDGEASRKLPVAVARQVPPSTPPPPRRRRTLARLLPLLLVAIGLTGAAVHDFFSRHATSAPQFSSAPRRTTGGIEVRFHDEELEVDLGEGGVKPAAGGGGGDGRKAFWEPSMRFGLATLDDGKGEGRKRLTCYGDGNTNNTCVRLDGHEWLFGERPFRLPDGKYLGRWPGRWLTREEPLPPDERGNPRQGRRSVWRYDDQHVDVTQTVELVASDGSGPPDTCLVRYKMENHDTRPHDVGLRFLLDTYIGGNDGVPFLIPGESALCDTSRVLSGQNIPQYIQACEKADLSHPGTVAQLLLRPGGGLEPPDRVTLGAWPNPRLKDEDERCLQEKTLWDVPVLSIQTLKDSAVTMYWNPRRLGPGASREVGFAYGVGSVAGDEGGGRLALTVGGSFTPRGELTVTAYVKDPAPGQTVTLRTGEGFEVASGAMQQAVPQLPAGVETHNSPVTWRLFAPPQPGDYVLTVESSDGATQSQRVTIRTQGLFGD
jgi:hypothetical protein